MNTKTIMDIKPLGFPWETKDPFLFCAHHRDQYPKGNSAMGVEYSNLKGRHIGQDFVLKDGWRMYHGSSIPGFPYHPHRGFETITINKEGFVDHADSMGAAGRFGAGDVQWMTAGRGIQHSEMFPLINQHKDNPLEIFQIWLNLPKSSKFVEPHFKMLWKEMIPVIRNTDKSGKTTKIDLIAGSINGVHAPGSTPDSWASNPKNQVVIITVMMEANARWVLPAATEEVNRSLYFYRGDNIQIDGQNIAAYQLIDLAPQEAIEIINADEDAYLLMLQGKPIGEPVAKFGPFVMNTRAEIQEAFLDYKKTQFGGWPWPQNDPVHDRDKARFAIHADGGDELK